MSNVLNRAKATAETDALRTAQSPVQHAPTSGPAAPRPPQTVNTTKTASSGRSTSNTTGNHVAFYLPPDDDTRRQHLTTTTTTTTLATDIEDECCDKFLRNRLADVRVRRHS